MGSRYNNKKFHIRSTNLHLLDILEDNYYMELGAVNLNLMNQLLEKKPIKLADFIYYDILNSGVGKITTDAISDIHYQINYLQNMRQRSSTSYFFLTCGVIKYYNVKKEEKFAPIILIPVELNYQTLEIICSSEPIINRVLFRQLVRDRGFNIDDETKYLDNLQQLKLNSVYAIDKACINISKDLNCDYDVTNYLTICSVTYQEFKYDRQRYMTDRSINETNHSDIANQYFSKFKGILPTNAIQKYVCLKAQAGNNFCVDGRLGSGKTHTIINIIGDVVSRDKKVLYINQDLDQTWEVEKKLRELGLGPYIKSLTYNKKDEVVKIKESHFTENTFEQKEIINEIDQFYYALNNKIHGFQANYIFETLAILKNENPKIIKILIEQELERHEVMHIYETLQKIETSLATITPYEKNLWRNLQITSNNITNEDLKERTKSFYELQISINTLINKFCKKYSISVPTNITDLYRFTTHLTSFSQVYPLLIWKKQKVREQVKESLNSIRTLTVIYNNVMNYYHNNIEENYTPGTMTTILNGIIGKYLTIEDSEYINALVKENNQLQNLIDEITSNIERLTALLKEISAYFDIKQIPNTFDVFSSKLINYLENNFSDISWYNQYLNEFPNFRMYQRSISEKYEKLKEIKEEKLNQYLINPTSFNFKQIENIPLDKTFEKHIKEFFVFSKKVNKKQLPLIYQSIKDYISLGKELNEILSVNEEKLNNSKLSTYEEYWQSFLDLFTFIRNLNDEETALFKTVTKKCTLKTITLLDVLRVLKTYKQEKYQLDSLLTKLTNYKIYVQENTIEETLKEVKVINQYLNSVLILKKEIRKIFKPNLRLTYKNIQDLILNDEKYLDVTKKLEATKKNDIKVLGVYYHGFDTDVISIGETISHLDDFIKRLLSEDVYDNLIENKLLDEMLTHINELSEIYNEWFNKFRSFSTCFKGGQSSFQDNTIVENVKQLQEFINHMNEIDPMVFVIDSINELINYKLIILTEHIKDSKLVNGVSDRYLYSVLSDYKEKALVKYPMLNNIINLEEKFELYKKNENNYCQYNLLKLREKSLDKEGKVKTKKTLFNNYEQLLDSSNKFTQIFIADLNVFNSNLELNRFDLVLIDDVHLANSNQYNRINETKQAILFGDSSFATSVTNNLMQRIESRNMISFNNRYIQMTHHFNNDWGIDNCYIYSPDLKISNNKVSTFEEFAKDIYNNFSINENKKINILVNNEDTRRQVYTSLVDILRKTYDSNKTIEILQRIIRIINTSYESVSYVDDVYIYYNDYYDLYPTTKNRIFRNYVVVAKNIHVYYLSKKNDKVRKTIEKDISSYLGQEVMLSQDPAGIVKTFTNKLKNKDIKYENGFGIFDLYIKTKNDLPNIALTFIGKSQSNRYSLLEDYLFYHDQYQQNNWILKSYYTLDLIDNMDQVITDLKKQLEEIENETH